MRYFEEAAAAFRRELTVISEGNLGPWADAQSGLGEALHNLGHAELPDRLGYFRGAEAAFRAVIETVHLEMNSLAGRRVQVDLGKVLRDLERIGVPEGLKCLKEAETIFRSVLSATDARTEVPQWSEVQGQLGDVLEEFGKLRGPDSLRYLKQAEAAFRAALHAITPEKYPLEWIDFSVALAEVLDELGQKAESSGNKSLKEAEAIYRDLLRTGRGKPDLQQRLKLQIGLAYVLHDLAHASDANGAEYFKEADTVLRDALTAASHDAYPWEWTRIQVELASNRREQKDMSGAIELLADVLRLEPDDQGAFDMLSKLYHEETFDFASDFTLNERWLARHPDDIGVQTNFAESHFTVARFDECSRLIDTLLVSPDSELSAESKTALRAIQIAALLASDQTTLVGGKMRALITGVSQAPASFQVECSFVGTTVFINQNEELVRYRKWLGRLLDSFRIQSRQRLLRRLRELEAEFKKRKGI